MRLLVNLKLHMWLMFVTHKIFLLDSAALGNEIIFGLFFFFKNI